VLRVQAGQLGFPALVPRPQVRVLHAVNLKKKRKVGNKKA
jgi:hypothetical protein